MLAALIADGVLVLLLAGLAVFVAIRTHGAASAEPEPVSWFGSTLKKRVIVHLRDSSSIEGALMSVTDDGVILRAGKLLAGGGKPDTPMAGEVFVPRENVAFAQLDE
jgi:hypothetical protein